MPNPHWFPPILSHRWCHFSLSFLHWNIGAHEGHVMWMLEMKESLLLEGTSMGSLWLHLAIRIDVNSDVLPGKWTGTRPAATHYQPITWAGGMKQKKPAGDIRAQDSLRPHVGAIRAHLCTHWFLASVSAPFLLWIWPIFSFCLCLSVS